MQGHYARNKRRNSRALSSPSPQHERCMLVVTGTSSGVRKTTVSCGLIATFTLNRWGHTVHPFKVGLDFLDGVHHELAVRSETEAYCSTVAAVDDAGDAGGGGSVRKSHNLDG